jgi:hypothetical protein
MEDEDAECGDETVEIENDEASWSTRFHVGAEFLRKRCLFVRSNCDASSQKAWRRPANRDGPLCVCSGRAPATSAKSNRQVPNEAAGAQ